MGLSKGNKPSKQNKNMEGDNNYYIGGKRYVYDGRYSFSIYSTILRKATCRACLVDNALESK